MYKVRIRYEPIDKLLAQLPETGLIHIQTESHEDKYVKFVAKLADYMNSKIIQPALINKTDYADDSVVILPTYNYKHMSALENHQYTTHMRSLLDTYDKVNFITILPEVRQFKINTPLDHIINCQIRIYGDTVELRRNKFGKTILSKL